tara:strand:+ start:14 stop:208 length:195 start_codon:yes stop_codon:yes gene_type:complete
VKKRLNKIFEIAWLFIGITSIIAGVYFYIKYGLEPIKPLLLITPVSAVFYYSRRQRGKKIESEQ